VRGLLLPAQPNSARPQSVLSEDLGLCFHESPDGGPGPWSFLEEGAASTEGSRGRPGPSMADERGWLLAPVPGP